MTLFRDAAIYLALILASAFGLYAGLTLLRTGAALLTGAVL